MTQPTQPPSPPEGMRFNAPPGWPTPPPGWSPPADFQPDPSWAQAPADWQWWTPVTASSQDVTQAMPSRDVTQAMFGAPPAYVDPPTYADPPIYPGSPSYAAGPSPSQTPAAQRSWVARHRLLAVALVVVALLAVGGIATAGVVIASNRGSSDKPSPVAGKSPDPVPSSRAPEPTPQPSESPSADPNSPQNKAACAKAAGPNRKAIGVIQGLRTKKLTNAAAIAAIPPIQAELNAAAEGATGTLQRDLREYALSLGALRTALMQGRNSDNAAAKVGIYAIIITAQCSAS